jgi:hypothetical protein
VKEQRCLRLLNQVSNNGTRDAADHSTSDTVNSRGHHLDSQLETLRFRWAEEGLNLVQHSNSRSGRFEPKLISCGRCLRMYIATTVISQSNTSKIGQIPNAR